MERIGLKVEQNRDGTIRIYQPPGDRNALGRIRFNFPNKFLVYQHDTPDKHLFAHDKRAYSHGCMRVENPLKYGEVLLGLVLPNEHYSGNARAEDVRRVGGQHQLPDRHPGSPHLSGPRSWTMTESFRFARRRVRPRSAPAGDPQGLRPQDGGQRRRPAEEQVLQHRSAMPPGTFGSAGGDNFFGGGFCRPPVRRQPAAGAPKTRARVGDQRAAVGHASR